MLAKSRRAETVAKKASPQLLSIHSHTVRGNTLAASGTHTISPNLNGRKKHSAEVRIKTQRAGTLVKCIADLKSLAYSDIRS